MAGPIKPPPPLWLTAGDIQLRYWLAALRERANARVVGLSGTGAPEWQPVEDEQ